VECRKGRFKVGFYFEWLEVLAQCDSEKLHPMQDYKQNRLGGDFSESMFSTFRWNLECVFLARRANRVDDGEKR
jgi:hypothetical protein